MKFARDRRLWRAWLYEARRRYGLCVLDYTVTSNHVHLLVRDHDHGEIAASMQLIEGCTGQAYNRRKRRSGAFWEDQYHAAAVQTGEHLARCVAYIDLNPVRAGLVRHPAEWEVGGYHEIQQPPARYRIVDRAALADAFDVDLEALAEMHRNWVDTALREGNGQREPQWTESVAVGSRDYVETVQRKLGSRGHYRTIEAIDPGYVLREPPEAYGPRLSRKTAPLRLNSA